MKIEAAVKKETTYISVSCAVFSVLLQSVFLCLGKWDITVLFGNLLGLFAALLNFFLMALTVQEAVKKQEEKEMRSYIKRSQLLRNFMLLAFACVGALLACFNIYSVLIPFLFPRCAIFIRPLFIKDENSKN